MVRKSFDKGKDATTSKYPSSSKSPEPSRKKTGKKGAQGFDKESKEVIKSMESQIEALRKSSFQEINRLEAMLEKEHEES